MKALDPERPWAWTHQDVEERLNPRQHRYIQLLRDVFRIKTATGRVVDYEPQPYQVHFHAHSPLALGKDAPDRLVEKGRGLGLTLMTGMDLLLAHQQPRIHVPVAGRQVATGDEFVQKLHELMQDARIEGFFDPDPEVTSMVRLGNGSTIEPVPGGNPASLRGRRAPAACFDEYAFHPRARDVWRAGRGALSEGGQLTVLSTHNGSDTHFFELTESARKGELGFARFWFPAHDPDGFDVGRPVTEQVASGRLRLLAPWIDIGGLEKLRREDPLGYRQENLCEVMDATLNLLSRDSVAQVVDELLADWESPVRLEESPRLAQLVPAPRVPRRPKGSDGVVAVGVDFASLGDLSAYTAFEASGADLAQRWLAKLEGVPTPLQNELLRLVVQVLRPQVVVIDMTGPGTGLYEYAAQELRCSVVGIHFAQRVEIEGQKVPVKKAMALHLGRLVTEGRVRLLGQHELSGLQERHLAAVRRGDLDAPRKTGEGHADIFWADALALWGLREHGGDTGSGVLRPSWRGGLGGARPAGADEAEIPEAGVLRPSWRRRG